MGIPNSTVRHYVPLPQKLHLDIKITIYTSNDIFSLYNINNNGTFGWIFYIIPVRKNNIEQ